MRGAPARWAAQALVRLITASAADKATRASHGRPEAEGRSMNRGTALIAGGWGSLNRVLEFGSGGRQDEFPVAGVTRLRTLRPGA